MNRNKAYKITKILILASLAVVLIWDLYAQLAHGLSATVSYAVWEFCQYAPFVPFLTGFVCGHLFWSKNPEHSIKEVPHQIVYGQRDKRNHWHWSTEKQKRDSHTAIVSNVSRETH